MAAIILFSVFAISLGLFFFIVWIRAILEIANADFSDHVIKIVWLLFTIFMPFIGSICWYLAGRNMRTYAPTNSPYSPEYCTATTYKPSDLV